MPTSPEPESAAHQVRVRVLVALIPCLARGGGRRVRSSMARDDSPMDAAARHRHARAPAPMPGSSQVSARSTASLALTERLGLCPFPLP